MCLLLRIGMCRTAFCLIGPESQQQLMHSFRSNPLKGGVPGAGEGSSLCGCPPPYRPPGIVGGVLRRLAIGAPPPRRSMGCVGEAGAGT